jgi:hypothetical protein
MTTTTFAKTQAMALKLGAVAPVLFCTFSLRNDKKMPYQRNGQQGVAAGISDEALFTADDIYSMETIQHGQYFGLNMNKPLHVEGRGYLVCIDVDMKRKPEGSPQHQAIKNFAGWVSKAGALEELSVSGKGNHVFIFAKNADNILRKYTLAQGQEIEVFGLPSSDKKSILLTGEAMEGEVVDVDDLEEFLVEVGIAKERVSATPLAAAPAGNLEFLNLAAAPRANLEALKAPLQAPARQYANDPQVTYLKAVEALGFLDPNMSEPDWWKMILALQNEFGESGRELAHEWSSKSSKYKGRAETDYKYDRATQGGGVGIGTLFHIAAQHGYQHPEGFTRQSTQSDFSELTIDNDTGEVMPLALTLVSVHDVISHPSPPPEFVWDGYLPRGVVSMLAAHGGTGKSTIALMLCVAASLGRPLFGVETVQCNALFVSLEDSASVIRHRLANICQKWDINPASLDGKLTIADGTGDPELFTADHRAAGVKTRSYFEMNQLVKSGEVGLVVVDNASDAYGGDEIQRRQVRAFIRALMEVAKPVNCALLLLAHVDKSTSRSKQPENSEGYSGSTAWNNSVRSRLFMKRDESGNLNIEHQKSNLGRCHEPLTLNWRDGELPQLETSVEISLDPQIAAIRSKADGDRCITMLKMIDEFASRGQFCSPATNSRNHVHLVLKSDPSFQGLRLRPDDTKRLVVQCQRAKWIEIQQYKVDYKDKARWGLTEAGRLFAGLVVPQTLEVAESPPSANCPPT